MFGLSETCNLFSWNIWSHTPMLPKLCLQTLRSLPPYWGVDPSFPPSPWLSSLIKDLTYSPDHNKAKDESLNTDSCVARWCPLWKVSVLGLRQLHSPLSVSHSWRDLWVPVRKGCRPFFIRAVISLRCLPSYACFSVYTPFKTESKHFNQVLLSNSISESLHFVETRSDNLTGFTVTVSQSPDSAPVCVLHHPASHGALDAL